MSGSYVCVSYRREVVQRVRQVYKRSRTQNASFISFTTSEPGCTGARDGLRQANQDAATIPAARGTPSVPFRRSIEEDFLERLFEYHDPLRPFLPYSRRRIPSQLRSEKGGGSNFSSDVVAQNHVIATATKTVLGPRLSSRNDLSLHSLRSTSVPKGLGGHNREGLELKRLLSGNTVSLGTEMPTLVPPQGVQKDVVTDSDQGILGDVTAVPPQPAISVPSHELFGLPCDASRSFPLKVYDKRGKEESQLKAGECDFSEPGLRPIVSVSVKSRGDSMVNGSKSAPVAMHQLPPAVTPKQSVSSEKLFAKLLDPAMTSVMAWKVFLASSWRDRYALRVPSRHSKRSVDYLAKGRLGVAQQKLCQKFMYPWLHDLDSGIHPPPSTVLRKTGATIASHPFLWKNAMWSVLILGLRYSANSVTIDSQRKLRELLAEILTLWHHILQDSGFMLIPHRAHSRSQHTRRISWDTLLQSDQARDIREGLTRDFTMRFAHFFPRFRDLPSWHADLAALTSFVLLRKWRTLWEAGNSTIDGAQPFLEFIAGLLPYSNLLSNGDRHEFILTSCGLPPAAAAEIKNELKQLASNAVQVWAELQVERSSQSANGTQTPPQVRVELFYKRIGRALENRNVVSAEQLWQDANQYFGSANSENGAKKLPSDMYHQFIMTFMALRRPSRAVDIWNAMVQEGLEPSVHIWDAMLRGSGIAKDPSSIESMWLKMVQSGVKPDAQVWATRIHGLLRGGYWETGVRAFQTMSAEWYKAASRTHGEHFDPKSLGDIGHIPKPNTRVLNALIVGLARGRKHDQIAEAFEWARRLGIKADAWTFNPIFKLALGEGNPAAGSKLLLQMQRLGILPDVATFTMILDLLFREDSVTAPAVDEETVTTNDSTISQHGCISNEPTATQQAQAGRILEEMQRCSIQANAWTFATLINGLLKTGNVTAAAAVTKHMAANGISLSSQIYTTFVTYHFEIYPPDLTAVEALWDRARRDRMVSLDVFFFDRLIEGFARCDEVGRMMAALQQAGKRGKTPGWPAMTEVVRALGRVGDWTRIQEVIAGVRIDEQGRDDVRLRTGREVFWDVVGELEAHPFFSSTMRLN